LIHANNGSFYSPKNESSKKEGECMHSLSTYIVAFMISLIVTIVATPFVKMLAYRLGVVDSPNARKVHEKQMPRMGGLSIVLGFLAGFIYLWPASEYTIPILIGAITIVTIGILDDKFALSAKYKLLGQIAAAIIVVSSGLQIEHVNIPFVGYIDFGWMSFPITVFWIVGITNAINLIDGLDGLASGVSSIALTSMLVMAILDNQALAIALAVILLAGTLGFLFFNVHPAEIFMGDTGSLFIGYTISIISITGLFKSLTLFSLIIPVFILAVPIFDTLFAIVRRMLKRQKLSSPDKSHLHHCLLALGFSHRTTVHIIYVISIFFAASAIVVSKSILWGSLFILCLLLVMMQFTAEIIGTLKDRKTPLINTVKKVIVLSQALKSK
jgi:UDP-GlcNAc:undecaprenyl-phosphate GlcNAc-1-phosphate transferase